MMGLSLSTWLFGCVVLVLIIGATGFVVWPLRPANAQNSQSMSRKDMNITLYRERLAELENAVAAGEMTQEEADVQKEEAGRHLLEDAQAETLHLPPEKTGSRWIFVLAVIFVPLFAIYIYLQGDGWRLLNADNKSPPWDFIINRAQKSLEKNPDDTETRIFLARSYRALERYQDSADAYAKLNALNHPANPDYLVEEGEMIALTREGDLQGKPTLLFQQALATHPAHGRALWYAGLAALQRNDNAEAISHWQTLAKQQLPEDFRLVLSQQLKRLGAEVPAGPMQAETVTMSAKPVIVVKVSADTELTSDLPPDTPVFIYAKQPGKTGPPVAATRITLAELPAQVTLSDEMSIMGGQGLSKLDRWVIYARISLEGSANAQMGDPFGRLELDKSDALKGLPLVIGNKWPE